MVSGASGAARSQKAQQWKGPNTIGTRECAWQKWRKTGRDMQRRTRRSVSTLGGAASDTIIGRAAADHAGARPYRAHVAKTRQWTCHKKKMQVSLAFCDDASKYLHATFRFSTRAQAAHFFFCRSNTAATLGCRGRDLLQGRYSRRYDARDRSRSRRQRGYPFPPFQKQGAASPCRAPARAGFRGRNYGRTFLMEGEPAGEHGEVCASLLLPLGKKERLCARVPGRGPRAAKVDADDDC